MKLRYTPIRKIADGDTAEIFLATQHGAEGFEKRVILKRILPSLYADRQFRKLLVDEAHIAAGLNHSSIVQVLDLGEADGRYFMAMELVDGWTLERVLRRAQAAGVPVPPALALYITAEVCRALAYAHVQTRVDGTPLDIVHGDVCPDNVLLSAQGEVKLTDFGMAKAHSRRTQVTGILKPANAAYMSPEQATGQPVDARSDLFSAGSMLYTMIAGRPAFAAEDDSKTLDLLRQGGFAAPETVRPELSPDIHQLIQRAMSRSPGERFPNAQEMLFEVERVMRIALRPVGQSELMRWLSQLSEKDGVPALTRDTGAPATTDGNATPVIPPPVPTAPAPIPVLAPAAAPPAPRPMAALNLPPLPPPPPGVVPHPPVGVVPVLPSAQRQEGAAPAEALEDPGTLELADDQLEAEGPPPVPGQASDATVITPSQADDAQAAASAVPPAKGEPATFDIPKMAGVQRDRRRTRFVWIGSAAGLGAILLALKVMLSGSSPQKQATPVDHNVTTTVAENAAPAAQPQAAPEQPAPVAAPAAAEPPPHATPTPAEAAPAAAPLPAAEPTPAAAAAAAATVDTEAKPAAPAEPSAPADSPAAETPPARAARVAAASEKKTLVALAVKSEPVGCQVTAGGKTLGHTPLALQPKPGTTYHFTFTKAGYVPQQKTFAVSARDKQSLHVTLKKEAKAAVVKPAAAKPAPSAAPAPAPQPRKDRRWWETGR